MSGLDRPPGCMISPASSRGCEFGTRGCEVRHDDVEQAMASWRSRRLQDSLVRLAANLAAAAGLCAAFYSGWEQGNNEAAVGEGYFALDSRMGAGMRSSAGATMNSTKEALALAVEAVAEWTERPILFAAPMIRALLAGTKTQTRRIVKTREPLSFIGGNGEENEPSAWGWFFDNPRPRRHGYMVLARGMNETDERGRVSIPCPYGLVGDRLWVRETFQPIWSADRKQAPDSMKSPDGWALGYPATDGWQEYHDPDHGLTTRGKPSIYMPRWASRITLEITDVRVQRLQAITEEDARAEGARHFHDIPDSHPYGQGHRWSMGTPSSTDQCLGTARFAFANLWDSINGNRSSWSSNPFVWAISFKRVETGGGA